MKTINTILSFLALVFSVLALSLVIANPSTGPQGPTGPQGSTGEPGESGTDGEDGVDGETPYIGENGNWWIDGVDTGVIASPEAHQETPFDDVTFGFSDQETIIEGIAEFLTNEAVDELERSIYLATLSNQGYTVIDSANELMSLANPSGNYVLGLDLDLSNLVNWRPISFGEQGFSGVFDGAGFTISGLDIADLDPTFSDLSYLGLFQKLEGATIRNLTIDQFDLTWTGSDVGALAGRIQNAMISFVNVKNTTVKGTYHVGGLVGNSHTSILDNVSTFELTVSGTNSVGGLIGHAFKSFFTQNFTDITQLVTADVADVGGYAGSFIEGVALFNVAYGSVRFSGLFANDNYALGGMFGYAERSYLHQLYNYSEVIALEDSLSTRMEYVGGVAGLAVDVKASYIYAFGIVSIRVNHLIRSIYVISVGGIFGEMQNTLIYRSYNSGGVEVVESVDLEEKNPYYYSEYIGGLAGYLRSSGKITFSANVGNVVGGYEVGGLVGGTGAAIQAAWSTLEIQQSLNRGRIEGIDLIGGLMGSIEGAYNVIMEQTYNQGEIAGDGAVGGLLGFVNTYAGLPSLIRESYNIGTIYGGYSVGGLVGATMTNLSNPEYGSGYLNIEQSFNGGYIIPIYLGQFGADYRDLNVGAIIGSRYLGGTFALTSYVFVEGGVELYDILGDDRVAIGYEWMILPSAGLGMSFDTFAVESYEAFQEDDFIYAEIWDFTTAWNFTDGYFFPNLRQNILETILF